MKPLPTRALPVVLVAALVVGSVVAWAAFRPPGSPGGGPPVAPSAPTAPRNLTASPGDATVVLAWLAPLSDGGSAVANYAIYRGTSSGGQTLLTTVGPVLAYTDTRLTNGVTYFYAVAAVNPVGEGPRSEEAAATPSPWVNLVADGAPGSPPARIGHTAVYDATGNRMIVFGGRPPGIAVTYYSDVWVLSNANGLGGAPVWTNLIANGASGSPLERAYHTAVYDAAGNGMIVFGGRGGAWNTALNDVWVLSNANGLGGTPTWTNPIAPYEPGSPDARLGHSATYDAANHRMTVFGGSCEPRCNDVWVLENASAVGGSPTWTNLIANGAPGSPPALSFHTAVYDAADNRMVVFGGVEHTTGRNDVWILSDANGLGGTPAWTNLIADGAPGSPSARAAHSAVYDARDHRMIVFGGGRGFGVHSDVWVLSSATGSGGLAIWTNLVADEAPGSPPARQGHAAVYDVARNRMIMFGGSGASDLNDVWVLVRANGLR